MSAWLVFATLGIYPAQPASGTYVAGTPLVPRAKVQVAQGRTLVIEQARSGEATLNGKPISRVGIPHAVLTVGGTLSLAPR
jgi:putative alpha-1,2-mannosidase